MLTILVLCKEGDDEADEWVDEAADEDDEADEAESFDVFDNEDLDAFLNMIIGGELKLVSVLLLVFALLVLLFDSRSVEVSLLILKLLWVSIFTFEFIMYIYLQEKKNLVQQ